MFAKGLPKSPPLSFIIIGIIITYLIIAILRREFESQPRSVIKWIPFYNTEATGGAHGSDEPQEEGEGGEDTTANEVPQSLLEALNETVIEAPLTKAIITGHTKEESVDWMRETFLEPEYNLNVYSVDDPNSSDRHTPANKGHEAMPYLTHILDNYDNLSDYNIFLHPHQSSWHTFDTLFPNAADMVRRLNLDHVRRVGYMNMRCKWSPGCPAHIDTLGVGAGDDMPEQAIFADAWRAIFGDHESMPQLLGATCCAQFAVTREQIRSVPRERYEMLRDWIVQTDLDDSLSGRVFESLWQYVFLGKAVDCPSEEGCYCDGFGLCFKGEHNYAQWEWTRDRMNELRNQAERLEGQLRIEEGKDINSMSPEALVEYEANLQKLRVNQQKSAREAERLQKVYEEAFREALENGKTQQMSTSGQVL